MSASKRTRFNVFKRDTFTCQYCGQKSPGVVLECDHILPVSSGGKDEMSNLITSCFDCNRGKADKLLGDVVEPLMESAQREMERAEQLDAYNKWLKKVRKKKNDGYKELASHYVSELLGRDPLAYSFPDELGKTVKSFMDKLPVEEIKDALDVAYQRKGTYSTYTFSKYFCGVCWHKIKGDLK